LELCKVLLAERLRLLVLLLLLLAEPQGCSSCCCCCFCHLNSSMLHHSPWLLKLKEVSGCHLANFTQAHLLRCWM
jgi:hypothetical protein